MNTNGTVQSYVTTTPDYKATVNYTYASGLPDGKTDAFTQALLGKDYYLQGVLDFDPFVHTYNNVNDYDEAPASFTNPYLIHPLISTQWELTILLLNITDTWTYLLNAQNNVIQANFNSTDGGTEIIKFKY